jgi:glutamine synthetase
MPKDFHRPFPAGVIAPAAAQQEMLDRMREDRVQFLRLIFTDILGHAKNVEVPASQLDKALRGEIMFDGSSIEGFTRIEESDMLLVPDLSTYAVFPWEDSRGRVARLICDVYNADRTPFPGCPRLALRRTLARFAERGWTPVCGPELEFFLFQRNERGEPTVRTHDTGGYFDLSPVSTSPRSTSGRTRAGTWSTSWKRWASRSRRPTTRSLRVSTRSTSSTPRPWRRRTALRPSA